MSTTTSPLERNVESVSKIVALASKFGVLVGGVCVISYSLRINHFPQDLSVGDGILFLMAAACFGVIYIFYLLPGRARSCSVTGDTSNLQTQYLGNHALPQGCDGTHTRARALCLVGGGASSLFPSLHCGSWESRFNCLLESAVAVRRSIFLLLDLPRRPDKMICLQLYFGPRPQETITALFQAVVGNLTQRTSLKREDILINVIESPSPHWWAAGRELDSKTGFGVRIAADKVPKS